MAEKQVAPLAPGDALAGRLVDLKDCKLSQFVQRGTLAGNQVGLEKTVVLAAQWVDSDMDMVDLQCP